MEKIKYPLYIQTLSMLFAYVSVVILVFFICFNAKFGFGWEALLKSPAGDRAETIADSIGLHLCSSKQSKWDELLATFGKKYGVVFYLFDIFGNQLAGAKVTLPAPLNDHLKIQALPPASLQCARQFHPLLFPPPIGLSLRDPHSFAPRTVRFSLRDLHSFPPPPIGFPLADPHSPPGRFSLIDSRPFSPPPPALPFKNVRDKFITKNEQSLWICMPIELSVGNSPFSIPVFLIAASSNVWQNKLLFDFQFMGILLIGFILFSVIFWWPFVFNITRKLSLLTITAENIAEGNFTTLIETGLNDELDRLSIAIKSMSQRLNGFVQGQKRFLGDISHELITPLARLDLALELFDTSTDHERTALLSEIKDEVKEMNLMVNELLTFAKLGLQSKQPDLQSVSVLATIEKAIAQLNGTNSFEVKVNHNTAALAEPVLLQRAISNILRNSLRYAGEAGPISVEANDNGQTVSIIISDRGPGVPENILLRLGEPFFRPEFSRSRDSGGVGLGLAIVKSCTESCDGTLTISNRPGGGLQTEICLKKAS